MTTAILTTVRRAPLRQRPAGLLQRIRRWLGGTTMPSYRRPARLRPDTLSNAALQDLGLPTPPPAHRLWER